jgi:hypothetical protein
MGDFLFKLKILAVLLKGQFHEWRIDVWSRELDERYCCDGRECGCYGVSVRDVWNINNRSNEDER